MTRRVKRILCHDCCAILTTDERTHYVYQCHACVVIEHELTGLARRNPDHPDLDRLDASAVELPLRISRAA